MRDRTRGYSSRGGGFFRYLLCVVLGTLWGEVKDWAQNVKGLTAFASDWLLLVTWHAIRNEKPPHYTGVFLIGTQSTLSGSSCPALPSGA
jgi:hypothetical protein